MNFDQLWDEAVALYDHLPKAQVHALLLWGSTYDPAEVNSDEGTLVVTEARLQRFRAAIDKEKK